MGKDEAKRPRGRPAIPREVQEERLIGAALRLIEERGFDKMRVADVVGEAGMSSRSFYEFFDSKEDMVVEIVRRLGREFIHDIGVIREEARTPIEEMDRGLSRFVQIFTLAPMDLVGLGGSAATQVQHVLAEYVREVAAMVHEDIRRFNASGQVQRPPDAVQIELLFEGVLGLAVRYYSQGRGAELRELRPVFMDLFARALL